MEPKTKLAVSKTEAKAIRVKVRQVRRLASVFGISHLASADDAPAILDLLKDERVSGDVYTLPRPFSCANIQAWIKDHEDQARKGEGLLMVVRDDTGQVITLTDFQFWPEYAACEFGGVIAAHLQNRHMGSKGIKELCDWVFEAIGVRLIVMTSSLDNIRSHKIFTAMGFKDMGEMDSVRPDGTVRRSLYWELAREY